MSEPAASPSLTRYPIPAGRHRVEEEIQRSRFITTLEPTPTLEAAREFVDAVRLEFPDARHHCFATVVGPPGSTARNAFSDDGEPHGTAGRPMLTALLHGGVGDVTAVVTRYFGGSLLGRGGLVRAYTGGVLLALGSLPRAEHVEWASLELVMGYEHVQLLQRLLGEFEGRRVQESFGADVSWEVGLPRERLSAFCAAVQDRSHGQVIWAVHRVGADGG